ncbi:MAG: hypothetical protein ONA69_07435 [candidate division KSB1 bacterium]|nr:hypothetical protein [candidate division KSB1 bacterium]MDZ7346613.1 hypothetical protein [candidate division KSB1 bacterium]
MRRSSPVLLFILSPLLTLAVGAIAAGIRLLDADLFAGVWWTASLLSIFAHPNLPTQKSAVLKRTIGLFTLFLLWILINDPILQTVQEALLTHPNDRFLLDFFVGRLQLSLAVLKIIDALWPSDLRSIFALLLSAATLFGLFPLLRHSAARLPQKWFESAVNGWYESATAVADYFRSSLAGALLAMLVVGTGTAALGFLETGMITAFTALCLFLPYGGWIIGPAGSLLFVEDLAGIPQILALIGLGLVLSQLRRLLPKSSLNEANTILPAMLWIVVAGGLYPFLGALVAAPAASIGVITAKTICNYFQPDAQSASISNLSTNRNRKGGK